MKCLVVDDDAMSRRMIKHFVDLHDGLMLARSCASAIEAANVLQKEVFDLIFLDVEMPEMTGIELVKHLTPHAQIILVTGKEDYALEAFNIEATDYLLKPVSYARFLKAVQRAQQRIAPPPSAEPTAPPQKSPPSAPSEHGSSNDETADEHHVFMKIDGRLVKMDLRTIQWIEAQGDYMLIHATDREFMLLTTMKSMVAKLPSKYFVRVHRSFLVRLDQITDVEEGSLVIGRKVIPIGGSYKEALLNRLNTF